MNFHFLNHFKLFLILNIFHATYIQKASEVFLHFTIVPLTKTVNIVLSHIFNKKQIETNSSKRTLKKLLDSCSKTVLSFNQQLYEQVNSVLMDSLLGPLYRFQHFII